MPEGDHLIRAAEQHLMVAHDAATAHRADADLLRVTLLADGGAVVDVVVRAVVLLVDGIGQHESGAAGSIQLVVVMLLDDLYIVVHAQDGGSAFAQLGQHVDAHGHIRTLENGHTAGELHHLQLQLFGKAGGADNDGQLVGLAVGQGVLHCSGRAEINDDVAFAFQLVQTVVNRDAVLLAIPLVNTGDHATVGPLGDHLAQHMAHPAADALNDNIGHLSFLFFLRPQPGRTPRRAE